MFTQMRVADRPCRALRARKTVTVLGAGIAGLVAAYELERLGHRVRVIEAGNRVGGRVYTHRFGDGEGAPFADLGAMRIRTSHVRTLHYLAELGLLNDIRPFHTLFSDGNNLINIADGEYVRVRSAADQLVERMIVELGEDRYRRDTLLFGAWLNACLKAIAPDDFFNYPEVNTDLLDLVDRIDLRPYLCEGHRSGVDLHAVIAAHPWIRSTVFHGRERMLDDVLDETSDDLYRLRRGMDTLTTTLAKRIRGPISLHSEVVGLSVRNDEVVVSVRHGSTITQEHCDFVLCTIPFPVMRSMFLEGFDDDKLAAIHETRYWPATKIALHCREPFWQEDGIKGGASFTGGLVRQTYYPPVDGDPSLGAVLLASYTIGPDADELAVLDTTTRNRIIMQEVSRMHPALRKPGMVLGKVHQAWGAHQWSMGAAAIRWHQDAATREEQQAAAARPQGRLFFAGEHCSSKPAWIEGAIESAIDALRDIEWFMPSLDLRSVLQLEQL